MNTKQAIKKLESRQLTSLETKEIIDHLKYLETQRTLLDIENHNHRAKRGERDSLMLKFARVATEGAYGDYNGCKTLESKLMRFKQLNPNA